MIRHVPAFALVVAFACSSEEEADSDATLNTFAEDGRLLFGARAKQTCEDDAGPWSQRAWLYEATTGSSRRDVAADFVVGTTNGPWTLSEHFSGCESYVFVPDSLVVSPNDPTPLMNSEADLEQLITQGPRNTHYFFVTVDAATAGRPFARAMQQRIDAVLSGLPDDDAQWWSERLHAVNEVGPAIDNWVATALRSTGEGFAIDRFQRIRGFGGLADVTRQDASLQWPWQNNLAALRHEVAHYNFEAARDDDFASTDWTTVHVLFEEDMAVTRHNAATVTLPSAEQMASFDTLWVDLTQNCDTSMQEVGNCDPWDRLQHVYMCDDLSCDDRQELARYITTYHREGRWFADASQLLPFLAEGGKRTFQAGIATSGHFTTLRLHFGQRRDDGQVPVSSERLWQGGNWTESYDAERPPITVEIPSSAKRVVLSALISGHGGEDDDNCAEFCDHQHTFSVGGESFLASHPDLTTDASLEGCVDDIDKGTVPNQNGTWWFERASWCPGKQVDPWVWDITEHVTPGESATLSYTTNYGEGVDGGNIVLESWITVWE